MKRVNSTTKRLYAADGRQDVCACGGIQYDYVGALEQNETVLIA